jgi:hypothetical protein
MIHSYPESATIRLGAAQLDRRARLLGPLLAALHASPEARPPDPVTVRVAGPADAQELQRLAELDSASVPAQPLLIGERAGRPAAALSLVDGAVVADPFVASADVVALLELRARQLRRQEPNARRVARRRVSRGLRVLRHGDL